MRSDQGTAFAGFGHYAPERVVENAEIEAALGVSPGWIERRTGIRSRRYAAADQALSDIALPAARMALDQAAGVEIGLLLLATSTPDHLLPPSAPLLAHRLGLACGAMDMAVACSGFVYALQLADAHCRKTGEAVLIVAANILSRRINPDETASRVLFADAAGAVVIQAVDDPARGVVAADLGSDGAAYDLITIPAGGSRIPFAPTLDPASVLMTMSDGARVYAQAVETLDQSSRRALDAAASAAVDIAYWAPHQANARIIGTVATRLGLADTPWIGSLAEYGNSSAATIPFSLSLNAATHGGYPNGKMLISAIGAGFVYGSLVFHL